LDLSAPEVDALALGERRGRVYRLCAGAAGLISVAALAGNLDVASFQAAHSTPQRSSSGVRPRALTAALPAPAPAPEPLNHWWTDVPGAHAAASTTVGEAHAQQTSTPAPDWFDELTGGSGAGTPLAPRATMNDGNPCADDEEEYQELCYKKCSTLTYGQYPIRSSAWTCCKKQPCTLLNSMHNVGICSGFDIAGDVEGKKACPHTVGTCLTNEEVHIGMCYKKCSLLAPGYPNRFGPETCCKVKGLSCAIPGNSVTGGTYAVGGGADDNDPSTPDEPHKPMKKLTENS